MTQENSMNVISQDQIFENKLKEVKIVLSKYLESTISLLPNGCWFECFDSQVRYYLLVEENTSCNRCLNRKPSNICHKLVHIASV